MQQTAHRRLQNDHSVAYSLHSVLDGSSIFATIKKLKKVVFQGQAKDEIRNFPVNARRIAGEQIMRLQSGLNPADSKPMRTIGAGVREIRIQDGNQYRVIYLATFDEAIYILSGFSKKSQKTAKTDIEKAKSRLAALQDYRRTL
jgi:putative addiction module killer protein